MWGQDGWRSHRLVSYRARYLRFRWGFFLAPVQARILFETFFGVEGVESSPRSYAEECRHLGWAALFYHNPVSQVGTYSRSAGQLQVFVQTYHSPSSVRQQRFNCHHTRFYHTPKHTLWVFGRAITPPFYHPPYLSHPQTHLVGVRTSYHTPWFITPPLGPLRAALYHPGYTRYQSPPQDTTPGDNIFKSQNVITGVCYLVSITVIRRRNISKPAHQTTCKKEKRNNEEKTRTNKNWKGAKIIAGGGGGGKESSEKKNE